MGRTVEVFCADRPPTTDWTAAFAGTDPDPSDPADLDAVHDQPGLALDGEPA